MAVIFFYTKNIQTIIEVYSFKIVYLRLIVNDTEKKYKKISHYVFESYQEQFILV